MPSGIQGLCWVVISKRFVRSAELNLKIWQNSINWIMFSCTGALVPISAAFGFKSFTEKTLIDKLGNLFLIEFAY